MSEVIGKDMLERVREKFGFDEKDLLQYENISLLKGLIRKA